MFQVVLYWKQNYFEVDYTIDYTGGRFGFIKIFNGYLIIWFQAGVTGARVSGQVGLVSTDRDKLYAFGSHQRSFDSKFDTIHKSNTAGLGFSHSSQDGRTNVGVQGGATFVPGFKPQPSITFGLNHNFKK